MLVVAVVAIAMIVAHIRVVAGGTWDDLTYHATVTPPRMAAASAIHGLTWPAWWDGTGFGVPLLGEASHGALYPLAWLASTPRAVDLVAILHVVWLAVGVALWARRDAGEIGAVVAAVLVGASGLVVSSALRGALPALAHLPWLGLAASLLATRPRIAIAGVAAAIGAIALAGQPGILVDAIAAIGLAIGAAQWVPAIVQLVAHDAVGKEIHALPLARFVELVMPGSLVVGGHDPFALPSLFVGAPLLALAATGVVSKRRVAFGLGVFALALLGGRVGALDVLGAPELHLGVLAIVLGLATARGVDALVAGDRRAVLALGVGGLATIAALVALVVLRRAHPEQAEQLSAALLDGGLALVCLAGVVAFGVVVRKPHAAVLALLVAPGFGAMPRIAPTTERDIVEAAPRWASLVAPSGLPHLTRVFRPAFMLDTPTPSLGDGIVTLAGDSADRWDVVGVRSEDPARSIHDDATWHASAAEGGAMLDRYGIRHAILPSTVLIPRKITARCSRSMPTTRSRCCSPRVAAWASPAARS
ncbi:MAG: hypothetical protein NT062_20650 [Proteobacteria bacterium]|nr:hypothetical protein [Pseudomonadota bacterium]